MAYGLKTITGNYQSNGSGRDWFFLGDFEYRNGRRTPQPNTFGSRPEPPPMQPRGAPAEVQAGRKRAEHARLSQADRWKLLHMERGEGLGGAQSQSLSSLSNTPCLSWKEATKAAGRRKAPKGRGSLAKEGEFSELTPNVPGRAAEGDQSVPPGPGDHTRGIRGSAPHFAATSHNLGQVESGLEKRFEVELAAVNRAARVHEADKTFKRQEGDHSLGIVAKALFHKSTLSELGEGQNFTTPDYGAPHKYRFAANPIFFDKPDLQAKKAQEGDHCLGIKANQPHYKSTYSELGDIPDWPKKRYDFGVIADTRYRFTMWRD